MGPPETRDEGWIFFRDRFDRISARVPDEWGRQLLSVAEDYCDDAHRDEIVALFGPKVDRWPGGPRVLAQIVERVSLCSAARKLWEPSVKVFLEKR